MTNRILPRNILEIRNNTHEKTKNLLSCKIACVIKSKTWFEANKKITRTHYIEYPLVVHEYEQTSYKKKFLCPNCLSEMELSIKSEKAGLQVYKLTIMGIGLLFIIANALLLGNYQTTTFWKDIITINAELFVLMIIILILESFANYDSTRTIRSIRLKLKVEYSKRYHKILQSRRNKIP